MEFTGREAVLPFGDLWTIGESTGTCDSIMTLGYDPATKRFVGTFVTSVMTHLWPYVGSLDAKGRKLILDSEGPSFSGDGTMAKYQDTIEFLSDDHRTLSSQVLGPDGVWQPFMKADYRRSAQ
jgi:hypothetical protein